MTEDMFSTLYAELQAKIKEIRKENISFIQDLTLTVKKLSRRLASSADDILLTRRIKEGFRYTLAELRTYMNTLVTFSADLSQKVYLMLPRTLERL